MWFTTCSPDVFQSYRPLIPKGRVSNDWTACKHKYDWLILCHMPIQGLDNVSFHHYIVLTSFKHLAPWSHFWDLWFWRKCIFAVLLLLQFHCHMSVCFCLLSELAAIANYGRRHKRTFGHIPGELELETASLWAAQPNCFVFWCVRMQEWHSCSPSLLSTSFLYIVDIPST